MIDFPVATAVGEEFTAAAMTYVWNGQGWTVKPAAGGGAPVDAYTKAESDAIEAAQDAKNLTDFVNVTGDTMTGQLNTPTIYVGNGPAPTPMRAGTVRSTECSCYGYNFNQYTATTGVAIAVEAGFTGVYVFDPISGSHTWVSSTAAAAAGATPPPPVSLMVVSSVGLTNYTARLISTGVTAQQPSVSVYDTQAPTGHGIYAESTGRMSFGQMDGFGNNVALYFNCGTTVFQSLTDNCIKPTGGAWIAPSDARIKDVLGDYNNGLAAVKALHPVRYSYKGNDTYALPETGKSVPYPNSPQVNVVGREFVGLVAQEVETTMPEMVRQVDGYIDGIAVTDMRNLDTGPLVFALINAVKELSARIEALEAA